MPPASMAFQLALVIHKGSKLNGWPFLPPTWNEAVKELSKEKEGGMVITPDFNLWAKTADALTQLRTCNNSRWHSAGELLKKATGTAPELLLEVLACHVLQRCMHASPDKEVLLLDCCERWMVWEHVTHPLLGDRQRPTGLDFLEQTVHEMWQLTICAVAVVAPWRLLCHKIVVVWNRRTPLTTKFGNQDTTGNTTCG